jgi:hypothetical protein
VDDWADIQLWLAALRRSRQVFHSEADFQHALALAIAASDPMVRVRLETRPVPKMRLDVLVSRPDLDGYLAVELKYLTAAWAGETDGEHFELLSQAAQDIRAYDVLKDLQRVERLVDSHAGWSGLVLVLTNDPAYWSQPSHGHVTNADAFRIYEGQLLSGGRVWGPRTGAGTIKDRVAAIELRGSYKCHWSEYSSLPGSRGTFRLLALHVTRGILARSQLAADPAGQAQAPAPPGPNHRLQAQPIRPGTRDAPGPAATRRQGTAPVPASEAPRYSASDLRAELLRFERELRRAGLKDTSVTTYVDRTGRFLKWLEGDYQPRGPNLYPGRLSPCEPPTKRCSEEPPAKFRTEHDPVICSVTTRRSSGSGAVPGTYHPGPS